MDVATEAGRALLSRADAIAYEAFGAMLAFEPGRHGGSTQERRAAAVEDMQRHLLYLAEALLAGEPALLRDYVRWADSLATGQGRPPGAVRDELSRLGQAVGLSISEEQAEVSDAYLRDAALALEEGPAEPSPWPPVGSLGGLAERYLRLLLEGARDEALRAVDEAALAGVSVPRIHAEVLTPVMHHVGELWQHGRLSVAMEHYATAATEHAIGRLYGHVVRDEGAEARSAVVVCAAGERHELGARMVADCLEAAGWQVYFLGGDVPAQAVSEIVRDRDARLLAVSVTMLSNLRGVRELVAAVRAEPGGADVRVLVGGRPLEVAPGLRDALGADGTARWACDAPGLADGLLAEGGGGA